MTYWSKTSCSANILEIQQHRRCSGLEASDLLRSSCHTCNLGALPKIRNFGRALKMQLLIYVYIHKSVSLSCYLMFWKCYVMSINCDSWNASDLRIRRSIPLCSVGDIHCLTNSDSHFQLVHILTTRSNGTCWKYLESWLFQLHFDVEKLHSNTFWHSGLLVLIHCDQPSWSHSRHHVVQQVVAFAQDCVPGCPRGIQISSMMQSSKVKIFCRDAMQT